MLQHRYIFRILKFFGHYSNSRIQVNYGPRDIFVCEFPKSGITYFMHLCCSAVFEDEVNYFNLDQHIVDVHKRSKLNNQTPFGLPTFYKNHYEFSKRQRNFPYIIYLFRDPVDVFVSYHNYVSYFLTEYKDQSFTKFIRSRFGVDRWNSHTSSYLNVPNSTFFIPIEYDRLVSQPEIVLSRLNKLFGWELESDKIAYAVNRSKKENMETVEALYANGGRLNSSQFIGQKKFKVEDVLSSDIKYIKTNTDPLYRKVQELEKRFWA